jgi:hypothetical protein
MLAPYDPDLYLAEESLPDRGDIDDIDVVPADQTGAEFVLEKHLEEFLLGNWTAVNWGRPLALWEGADGSQGHQLSTSIGRLDLLCIDTSTDALVVVELKRGWSADKVIGQVARYMGWVRTHLATDGQAVEGIVVAHEFDERLRYAATAVPGLAVLTYRVNFELVPMPELARS